MQVETKRVDAIEVGDRLLWPLPLRIRESEGGSTGPLAVATVTVVRPSTTHEGWIVVDGTHDGYEFAGERTAHTRMPPAAVVQVLTEG